MRKANVKYILSFSPLKHAADDHLMFGFVLIFLLLWERVTQSCEEILEGINVFKITIYVLF